MLVDSPVETGSLRVAVLAGGVSAERESSLATGRNVLAALTLLGHCPRWIDPARLKLSRVDWTSFDVAFLALHGGPGEDGQIQSQLESFEVAYTGSSADAARLAMSKSAAKERFIAAGVPTPEHLVFCAEDSLTRIRAQLKPLGFPLVVKPDRQGSSLGVCLAADAAQLGLCVAEAGCYDSLLVAEPRVMGREISVAVLGRTPIAPVEIVAPAGFCDYNTKQDPSQLEMRCDKLRPALRRMVQETAVAACAALETAGLVDVDLILDADNRPWVLEVNAAPALDERRPAMIAARHARLTLADVCQWMLGDAWSRRGVAALAQRVLISGAAA